MKDIFFTSDLHFRHTNIVEYCKRPWTSEDQTEEIIKRWNSKVGIMDDVYTLGDFMFGGHTRLPQLVEIVKELNGNIHFIKGNHDDKRLWAKFEDLNIPHVAWVKDYHEMSVNGIKIVLCHFPFESWNLSGHGSWNLHGHMHGSLPPRGKRFDVGIDNHPEHQVFSLQEIHEHMSKQEVFHVGHHTGER